jgi:hypothetical protein
MIYQFQLLCVIVIVLSAANALKLGNMRMALSDYKNELAQTARNIAAPGTYTLIHLLTNALHRQEHACHAVY